MLGFSIRCLREAEGAGGDFFPDFGPVGNEEPALQPGILGRTQVLGRRHETALSGVGHKALHPRLLLAEPGVDLDPG